MSLLLLAAAFVGALIASQRSLGAGVCAVLTVGYLNGLIRGNFSGAASAFIFDSSLIGLYLGSINSQWKILSPVKKTLLWQWIIALVAWPTLLSLAPVNHPLVQLVALRGTILFVPMLAIGWSLTNADRVLISKWFVVLNAMAAYFAALVYFNGLEAVFPRNAATELAYRSRDIAGGAYRIPASFLSAHAYGGTMLASLPMMLHPACWKGSWKLLQSLGVVLAIAGLLACGARQPLVVLAVAALIAVLASRGSGKVTAAIVAVIAIAIPIASSTPRFQRILTLQDTELVERRINMSANDRFFDLLLTYPAGAGMGSSVGTSIPSFLAAYAPQPIGMENEMSRILIDQGWMGLGLWIGFVAWVCSPPAARQGRHWPLLILGSYSLVVAIWLTAFIGTGTLSSIPGSAILMLMMGTIVRGKSEPLRRSSPNPLTPPLGPGSEHRYSEHFPLSSSTGLKS